MTTEKMVDMLSTLVGGGEDYDVLFTYLELAGNAIISRAYPYDSGDVEREVPQKYQHLQIEIALYMLNKRGAEGQTEHSENNIRRSYGSADIPDDMLSRIVPYVGVIGS